MKNNNVGDAQKWMLVSLTLVVVFNFFFQGGSGNLNSLFFKLQACLASECNNSFSFISANYLQLFHIMFLSYQSDISHIESTYINPINFLV